MKKVFIGLLIGVVLCGAAGFVMLPNVKQASYDSGYNAGNKKGIAEGTTAGIAQGVAELKALMKHQQDSIAQERANAEEQRRAAARRAKKVPPPVQNWHVIDGKISHPVVPDNTPVKDPAQQ